MTYVVMVDQPVPSQQAYITKTVPLAVPVWAPSHLALIFHMTVTDDANIGELTHVGAVVKSSVQKVSTYEKRVKIEEIFPVNPMPIDSNELDGRLPPGELNGLLAARNRDIQVIDDDSFANALIAEIGRLRPSMPPVIDWLRALNGSSELGFTETEVLWREQRDAANVGLRIGGFSATPLRAWRRPAENEPFVAGIVPYPRRDTVNASPQPSRSQSPAEPPSEPEAFPRRPGVARDQSFEQDRPRLTDLVPEPTEPRIVEHDARAFPGWRPLPDQSVHIHTFANGDRRMEIINVDSTRVEAKTGADLIYYHVNTTSFVLVQYKRLRGRSFPIDDRLLRQLDRMNSLSELNQEPKHPDDWRIGPDFGFIKLADTIGHDTPPDHVIPGLYLPLTYVGILLAQNHTQLGYDTVGRYLSNTQFIELVAYGLVGTVGVTIEHLHQIVSGLVEAGDSVVIAKDNSDETTAERQSRLRSRKAIERAN